jgi:hypothetical protein
MRLGRLVLLLSLPLLMSRVASAECPIVPRDIRTIAKYSAVAFSGTVTNIESISAIRGGETVTFEVERLWKGSLSKQFKVYNVTFTGIADVGFVFQKGTKYLVFAHHQTMEDRAAFGLAASGPVALRIGPCGSGTRTYEEAKVEIAKLGAGRTPSPN